MVLTKEYLSEKLVELNQAWQSAVNNGNALFGAIQTCEQLIKVLDEPEPTKPEPIDTSDLRWIGPGPDPREAP